MTDAKVIAGLTEAPPMKITVRLRLKDKHGPDLCRQARAVNFVWNYVNETQRKAARDGRKWLSNFDLQRLTAGSSKMLGVHSCSIHQVCTLYDRSRVQRKLPWLRWRSRRSLGWVPFKTDYARFDGVAIIFNGKPYEPMHLRDVLLAGQRIYSGSFSQDARGRWYINLVIERKVAPPSDRPAVGIDLGLKTLVALSDGGAIEAPRIFRASEFALATAQRARKSARRRAISSKITNRRMDFLHKASHDLATKYALIAIGDVSASKLARTTRAKSVYDAGWSTLKRMISYKAIMHGGRMIEVSEAYSSQTCSECGSLPPSRPRGIAGIGIREWRCDDCGTVHDRDVNAARNILRLGHQALAEGAAIARRCQLLNEDLPNPGAQP